MPSDQQRHQSGDQIGPYTLLEQLGDGGFGTVWKAAQVEPVKREVALKILKLGMDTLEVMNRFEQERQSLAMMDHPNIAKVLDAGATAEGRPYFVMELVHGVSITQFCLEKSLPLEQRLTLMQDVCAGVQHAHLKGIIHRDLKPSNILVAETDGAPVPKIIDFGIAKATTTDKLTEFTLVTRLDQFLGTPLYMSPEQADARSDIDTRSDVYSLGALLYELLTGQPPFDRKTLYDAGYDEMRRIIREVDPSPPSRRRDETTGIGSRPSKDLDLITLRALEKDRERRYQTATALADDIRRFLQHEPIHARAPSTLYLVQRWVRRHRVMAAAIAISLTAIALGSATTYWQKTQAESALRLMASTLSATDTISYARLDQMRDVLTIAAAKTDELPEPERLQLHIGLGKAFWGLSENDEALLHFDQAEALTRSTYLPPRALRDLREMRLLCLLGARRGEEAVTLSEKMLPEHERDLLPDDPAILFLLTVHAKALRTAGRPQEAVAAFEALFERLRTWPSEPDPVDIVSAHLSYPIALRQAGQPERALEEARKNIKLARRLLGAVDLHYARALIQAASECLVSDLITEAIGYQNDALILFSDTLGNAHFSTQDAKERLIDMYTQQGNLTEAIKVRRDMVEFAKIDSGPTAPETLNEIQWFIEALIEADQNEEALTLAKATVQDLQALKTPSSEITHHWLPLLKKSLAQPNDK